MRKSCSEVGLAQSGKSGLSAAVGMIVESPQAHVAPDCMSRTLIQSLQESVCVLPMQLCPQVAEERNPHISTSFCTSHGWEFSLASGVQGHAHGARDLEKRKRQYHVVVFGLIQKHLKVCPCALVRRGACVCCAFHTSGMHESCTLLIAV